MLDMINRGITPEDYAEFYKIKSVIDDFFSFRNSKGSNFQSNIIESFTPTSNLKPMSGATEKSLVIKVQMQGVTKPPMWREIIVPADFNFSQLHYAIQAAVGLDNCHLWQFQRSAYQHGLAIGIPQRGEYGFGLDECTHDADETPITAFLSKKDDKLVYVYDFRVDWIFDIKVTGIIDRNGDTAICKRIKSNIQASEYMGNPMGYTEIRSLIENANNLTDKQRKKVAEDFMFDDFQDFLAWADELIFDAEFVNEELSEIPDKWEDID